MDGPKEFFLRHWLREVITLYEVSTIRDDLIKLFFRLNAFLDDIEAKAFHDANRFFEKAFAFLGCAILQQRPIHLDGC